MELVFFYPCPYCGQRVPLPAPAAPTLARCGSCDRQFPIMPVDARCIRFIRIMLAEGRAALDPDFI
jgi:hypothetical protein